MTELLECRVTVELASNGYVITVSKCNANDPYEDAGDMWKHAVFVGPFFYETFDSAMRQVKAWYQEREEKDQAAIEAALAEEAQAELIALAAEEEEGTRNE